MADGGPSLTARRVAAYRLGVERLAAPFGDADADERLARDVAGADGGFARNETMAGYLHRRTAFFDRVVVNALERDVSQVAAIGAGYDGRSLRYAKPGVLWFEVDHAATQADKLARLRRLRIDVSGVTFVALDLGAAALAPALLDSGWNADASSLMLCEGVAVYLDAPVLEAVLHALRALATVGTRLAISLSPPAGTPEERARRDRLRATLEALGEPARNDLTSATALPLLTGARWRRIDLSERPQRAGFAMAAPAWEAAAGDAPATVGSVGRFMERIFGRHGAADLPAHVAAGYGVEVSRVAELDVGVFRIERRDGPAWVARLFPAERPVEATRGDAEILELAARAGLPAERPADPEPVTTLHGQAVLVTELAPGASPRASQATFGLLGDVLGRLHAMAPAEGAGARPGGGWHHLVLEGDARAELAAAAELLDDANARVSASQRALYEQLRGELPRADELAELPRALTHPDLAPANVLLAPDGNATVVDWTGAGRGPRLSSLGFLLRAAGIQDPRFADAVMAAYERHIRLEPIELERLASAIAARPLVLGCWAFCTGREQLAAVVERLPAIRSRAATIAARIRAARSAGD